MPQKNSNSNQSNQSNQSNKTKFKSGATRSKDCDDIRWDLAQWIGFRRIARRMQLGIEQGHNPRNWENGVPRGVMWNHLFEHAYKQICIELGWTEHLSDSDIKDDHLGAIGWAVCSMMHQDTLGARNEGERVEWGDEEKIDHPEYTFFNHPFPISGMKAKVARVNINDTPSAKPRTRSRAKSRAKPRRGSKA